MKKFIVLLLILGMASMANAALIDGSVTWTIDIPNMQLIGHGDSLGVYNGAVYYSAGGTFAPNGTGVLAAAGDNANTSYDTVYGGGYYAYAQDLDAENGLQTIGDWFVFDITMDEGASSLTVTTYNASNGWASPTGAETFTGIPEPMTIALLGLGGLMLRRRKKA